MPAPNMLEPIVAFLGRFPPFHRLDHAVLTTLSQEIVIRYFKADEVVFAEHDEASAEFYLVRKGLVALHFAGLGRDELIDYCDEGDIFGLRALLRDAPYSATARTKEDSLIYVVPWDAFRGLMQAHPEVSLYLAAGFAADRPEAARLLAATTQAQRGLSEPAALAVFNVEDQPMTPVRDVLTCGPEASIQGAAQRMRERRVGSIVIVDPQHRPLGIVTDTDLRDRVVSKALDASATPVSAVMSSPVCCLKEPQTVSDLISLVMQRGLHHFCFTESGTASSAVTGVLSEHDVVTAHGNHPLALRERIARTRDPDTLLALRDQADLMAQAYLAQHAGIPLLCAVLSGINDALIRSAIAHAREQLHRDGFTAPEEPFCWLSFGSEGREEQLLRTDLDNAIVYADPPEARAAAVGHYYLELGKRTIAVLVHAGFKPCEGNIMASNPELTLPLHAWTRKFAKLIRTPEPRALMEASIYFDLRPVEGAFDLADALKSHIFAEIDAEPMFLGFLAKNALQNPPPLSFFRGFVLERSGQQAKTFDIKARAMMPLVDGSRVLAYDARLPYYGTTMGRFHCIAEAIPELAPLCSEAAMAYAILLRIRTQEGFRTGTSGRYVDIERLNKLQRQSLRNTFSVVGELQSRLTSRYRTDFIR